MSWIEDSFDDWSFDFRHNGTWKIQKKLAEKEWIPENGEWNEVLYPAEAHAVYECVQVEGSEIGKIAILKLRIQIPEPSPPPPNENGAKYAKFNYATDNEINFLERLTDANCPATPRLLAVHTDIQHEPVLRGCYYEDEEQPYWVPGGYIVYILMEKLPGEDLTYFWTFPPQEREEIRQAFREAYLTVISYGVFVCDEKRNNIIWDKEAKRCYIIDFEDAGDVNDYPGSTEWTDSLYSFWGLSERMGAMELSLNRGAV